MAVSAFAPSAKADFTIGVCNAGGGCGTGNNFGSVALAQNGTGDVKVTITLQPNNFWQNSGTTTIGFYLPGITATIANLSDSTNFAATTSFNFDGFSGGSGVPNYGINYSGSNGTDNATLTFDVKATGLTPSSFASWTGSDNPTIPVFFVVDLKNSKNGLTGLVGATAGVPAPIVGGGLPGLIAACSGLIFLARRRRQQVA
jgi:hypothetical protein